MGPGPARRDARERVRVHASLERQGVAHRYEEFDDDHSDVDYRMDVSLPWLWEIVRGE